MKSLDQTIFAFAFVCVFACLGILSMADNHLHASECIVFGSEINGNNTVEFLGLGNC